MSRHFSPLSQWATFNGWNGHQPGVTDLEFANHRLPGGLNGGQGDARPSVTPGQEFSVFIQQINDGLVIGQVEATDDVGIAGFRLFGNLDTDRDGIAAYSIADDGTITITDLDDVVFGSDGMAELTVVAIDTAGHVSFREAVSIELTSDPLIPANTPFGYYIGINYESWEYGRTGYSISADLDQITQYFNLIKTYHDAAVGTADPTTPVIDSTQAEVINYIVATDNLQLVMGTNNNALAQGGYGTPWSAGLMTDSAYTDAWVQMLIDAFGSVQDVLDHLTAILLGNEVDANGPPPGDPDFANYITWIETSFDNLKASLEAAGLGSIPISTTIANYGSTNQVAVDITQYINDNWSPAWNSGTPFVLFNQYTPDGMTSTDFAAVESYFELIQTQVPAGLEVFIGETGYSTTSGTADPTQDQATVYTDIFNWLDSMDGTPGNGGGMVPMFPFIAFDRPTATPGIEVGFGIFGEDANSQPTGLKSDLVGIVPDWTTDPINLQMLDGDALVGTADNDIFDVAGGHGSIDGGDGNFDLLVIDGDVDDFALSVLDAGRGWRQAADATVHIESKSDGTTSIDIKNVEYVQFDDALVKVDDLFPSHHGGHGHHGWDHFGFG